VSFPAHVLKVKSRESLTVSSRCCIVAFTDVVSISGMKEIGSGTVRRHRHVVILYQAQNN
jgi:hypothetical protein